MRLWVIKLKTRHNGRKISELQFRVKFQFQRIRYFEMNISVSSLCSRLCGFEPFPARHGTAAEKSAALLCE